MSLYSKIRPDAFADFVGNKGVVSALKQMIDEDDLPSVILFHGSHGSGKTTLARMIPKYMKTAKQDIKELDIGAISGKDHINHLREQSINKPLSSRYKFYILDEFHAASADAKTASLKWLEDTPDHVKIILCTTELVKLPGTVKSRCVPYKLESLSEKEILTILGRACKKLGADVDVDVLKKIVDISDGVPRQALVHLESVWRLKPERALSVLSSVTSESSEMKSLFNCLLKNSTWGEYCTVIKGLKEEPETIRRSVLGYMSAIMLNQINGKKGFLNRLAAILEIFESNWYDSGRASLVKACYEVYSLGSKE